MSAIKLLIHAPTAESLKRAQNNARNLLELEPAANIQIVVNGAAAAEALHITDQTILRLLVLCHNSLDRQGLSPPDEIQVVAAAVQHLALQQAKGWSYMRA